MTAVEKSNELLRAAGATLVRPCACGGGWWSIRGQTIDFATHDCDCPDADLLPTKEAE